MRIRPVREWEFQRRLRIDPQGLRHPFRDAQTRRLHAAADTGDVLADVIFPEDGSPLLFTMRHSAT